MKDTFLVILGFFFIALAIAVDIGIAYVCWFVAGLVFSGFVRFFAALMLWMVFNAILKVLNSK